MKRLLILCLILLLCAGTLPVSAHGTAGDEIVKFSFDNGTPLNRVNAPQNISDANGFVIFPNLELDCEIQSNALTIRDTISDAFFDLQLYHASSIPTVREDATLSLQLKITDANASCSGLVTFRDSSYEVFNLGGFGFSGTDLILNDTAIGQLTVNAFNRIDLEFHYDADTSRFDTVYIFLNGERIKSYSIASTVEKLDHFRMCRYNNGSYILDELTYSYGITTRPADDPTQDTTDAVDDLIASIPDGQKHTTVVIASFDFDQITSINTSGDQLNQSGGIQAMNGLDAEVQNKEAVIKTTSSDTFIDFQFYNLSQFPRVDEDFVFSIKIKPLTADFSSGHFMDFRYNNGDWVSKSVSISNCQLKVGGNTVGTLPVGEYSLVEFVFRYSPIGKSTFSSYDVLLNGQKVSSYTFETEAVSINHFRMFRYRTGSFALGEMSLAYGVNSLIYQGEKINWLEEKKTNVDIQPQMPPDLPEPTIPHPTPQEPSAESEEATALQQNSQPQVQNTRGCRSAARVGAPMLLLLLLGYAAVGIGKSKKIGGRS